MSRPRPHNPESRRLVLGVAALALVLAAVAAAAVAAAWSAAAHAVMERDAGLAGTLLARHPGDETAIMEAITRPPTEAQVAAGRAAAARYGYDQSLPIQLRPLLRGPFLASIVAVPLLVLAAAAAVGAHARFLLAGVFRRARGIAAAAETIAHGNPRVRLEEIDDGELSMLSHRINQMAERLLAAMEQLEREKELLKAFLADVSHQLKTPLASVRMFTDLVHEGVAEDERRDFLERTQGQLDRMEWLIANLLAVARMEAGAAELAIVESPLRETIAAAVAGLGALAERRQVRLDWAPPVDSARIPHDPRWLEEALSNIVKNSIEHTPAGGTVSIDLETSAVVARVTVTDTGEGIAAEDLPRIFDRFFQARPGRAAAGGAPAAGVPATGTGIGLALARAIVDRHRGLLSAENVRGGGARFTITLPTRDI